jgi:hypothetical protein
MAVRCWRAAILIGLLLNAATIGNATERSGMYLAGYCSETRGLREVAQDETKISAELCPCHNGSPTTGRELFRHFASTNHSNPNHSNQSADSDLVRARIPARSQLWQRYEASRHPDLKPVASTRMFGASQRIGH